MNNYSVDRIENGFAVLEYREDFIEIPLEQLPDNIREGDILQKNDEGIFEVSEEVTEKTKEDILNLQNSLFSD